MLRIIVELLFLLFRLFLYFPFFSLVIIFFFFSKSLIFFYVSIFIFLWLVFLVFIFYFFYNLFKSLNFEFIFLELDEIFLFKKVFFFIFYRFFFSKDVKDRPKRSKKKTIVNFQAFHFDFRFTDYLRSKSFLDTYEEVKIFFVNKYFGGSCAGGNFGGSCVGGNKYNPFNSIRGLTELIDKITSVFILDISKEEDLWLLEYVIIKLWTDFNREKVLRGSIFEFEVNLPRQKFAFRRGEDRGPAMRYVLEDLEKTPIVKEINKILLGLVEDLTIDLKSERGEIDKKINEKNKILKLSIAKDNRNGLFWYLELAFKECCLLGGSTKRNLIVREVILYSIFNSLLLFREFLLTNFDFLKKLKNPSLMIRVSFCYILSREFFFSPFRLSYNSYLFSGSVKFKYMLVRMKEGLWSLDASKYGIDRNFFWSLTSKEFTRIVNVGNLEKKIRFNDYPDYKFSIYSYAFTFIKESSSFSFFKLFKRDWRSSLVLTLYPLLLFDFSLSGIKGRNKDKKKTNFGFLTFKRFTLKEDFLIKHNKSLKVLSTPLYNFYNKFGKSFLIEDKPKIRSKSPKYYHKRW